MPLLLRQAYYATCPYLANHHCRPPAVGIPPPATTAEIPPPDSCRQPPATTTVGRHSPSPACHRLQGTNSVALYLPLTIKDFVSLNGLEP
ncbi:unnamed protein product [Prunus armeniaca]